MIIKNAIFNLRDKRGVLIEVETVNNFNFDYDKEVGKLHLFKDKGVVCYLVDTIELISQNAQEVIYNAYVNL